MRAAAILALAAILGGAGTTLADGERWKADETRVCARVVEGLDGVEASFFVKAAPEACFQILADVTHLPEFMPGMKRIEVLERDGNAMVVRLIGDHGDLVQRRVADPPRRISWSLIRSAGLREMRGHWLIEPAQGGAVLRYALGVRPIVPVPTAIINWFQEKRLPELAHHVRLRIESGGHWIKPDYAGE